MMATGRALPWLALAFAVAGCDPGEEQFFLAPPAPPEADEAYNVIEDEDLQAEWACEADDSCWLDYLSFGDAAEDHAVPISTAELQAQLEAILAHAVEPVDTPLTAPQLREALVEAMNLDFLLQGLNERLLEVTTLSAEQRSGYTVHRLLFTDPYVGTFEAWLLRPDGPGPFPALLAIHGHGQDAATYLDLYQGQTFAARGYAVLALSMRADDADAIEDKVTRALLLDGFTFMAVRSYETLLALKYLRYRNDVDDERVALIGHSGGSVASNLSVRVEPAFAAYVSDLASGYFAYNGDWVLIDETAPAVHPYHERINDFDTSAVPILCIPYDSARDDETVDEVMAFLDAAM